MGAPEKNYYCTVEGGPAWGIKRNQGIKHTSSYIYSTLCPYNDGDAVMFNLQGTMS